jgi:hypothetical protein
MNEFFNLDPAQFPEPLQDIIREIEVKGKAAAPFVFRKALAWVWERESAYITDDMKQEIQGIAEGVCSNLGKTCDVESRASDIQAINMLPELVRMACTSFGAWGEATNPTNSLVQLRSLDFGSGPFANYTVLAAIRNGDGNDFATVMYPGMVGVITGISKNGIGLSEKVYMANGYIGDLLPGSYEGQPDVFVLRHILEYSSTKEEAEAYM